MQPLRRLLNCLGRRLVLVGWRGVERTGHVCVVKPHMEGREGLANFIVPLPGYEKVTALQSASTDVQNIFNLKFASQREWNKAAVEKMVRKYQTWSGDTGSMPVQIAVISVRIQYLTEHMRNNRKDKSCLRTLLKLVHQRREYLRYLARTDAHTFTTLLQELNLKEPSTVKYKRTKK